MSARVEKRTAIYSSLLVSPAYVDVSNKYPVRSKQELRLPRGSTIVSRSAASILVSGEEMGPVRLLYVSFS